MKVKICGITKTEEIDYLNEAGADYAGFVFYEKSKRFLSVENASHLMRALRREILKVAVTVEPDAELISRVEAAGFDILQIHGSFSDEQIQKIHIPVWRAYNSPSINSLEITERQSNITGYLLDAARFGSGVASDWSEKVDLPALREKLNGRDFILAGGLNPTNVAEGIQIFSPDIVDVSSGVEGKNGKDRGKILAFMKEAKA